MANQRIPLYIPTFINSADYKPARVLPRLYFYNGQVDCETWYIADSSNSANAQNSFPYFDHYNVVTGSFPTTDSRSLLFNNEAAAYGEVPTDSLYTSYWEKYISFLYNPKTRLLNCSAIIPLADYFKMELNDVVNFRGNYYHLRAINDYSLKDGTCNLQLLGPIIPDTLTRELPTIPPLTIDWLLVGGGASGGTRGNRQAGGGGAGRFVSSSMNIEASTIPITIGSGGASVTYTGAGAQGNDGDDSTIIIASTTYTSPGGGGGGAGLNTPNATRNGRSGGSGGGGAATGIGGSSTGGSAEDGSPIVGFGNAGESKGSGSEPIAGYGGGAGGTPTGLAWLNGTTYCVGGDGTTNSNGSTAGSGGGGGGTSQNSGAGANGICIIRYLGAPVASGGTITQSGGYTYHTFTSSGNFVY